VHAARNNGHAYADREVTPGFRSIAVPLHRWDGRMIAAINLGGSGADPDMLRGPLLGALRHTAAELSAQLI